jgi:DNA-binding SARP family transcriptional activator
LDDVAAMPRRVLSLLLVQAGQVVSTDLAIEEVWCGRPPRTARKAVQVYVHRLRKVLGPRRLQSLPSGYRLAVEPDTLDSWAFEAMLRRARAAGDLERAAELYAEALALWQGPPYADVVDVETVAAERRRLAELRLDAIEQQAWAGLSLGRHAAVIPILTAEIALNPFHESLYGLLMVALRRGGRQAEALDLYRRCRDLLVAQLGIEPTAELQRVHRLILNGGHCE